MQKSSYSTLKILLIYILLACLIVIAAGSPRKPISNGSFGSVSSNLFPTSDEDDEDDPFEDDARVYKNPRNSPSAMCPRDEEQARLLGQKCLRRCSSDEDCKSKKKKCLCDGACGMSCIKPDRECSEVRAPEMGRVRITGRLFGDRAIYSCEAISGLRLVGLSERVCQADGQWSGSPPVCIRDAFCSEAPRIEHARHTAPPSQRTFPVDTTLQYQCQPGFNTTGFPHAKCFVVDGMASWYGPDLICEPQTCGPPLGVEHGWTEGDCHVYNCHVVYHCAVGFELSGGRNERICTANGTWMPRELPTCVPVQCPIPENPANGKAIYTSCSYNSVVKYECRYGYRLVGEPSRRCGPDKQWTGEAPTCKEVPACRPEDAKGSRCSPGEPGCTLANCRQVLQWTHKLSGSGGGVAEVHCGHPGFLYNGWLDGIENGTMLGASIIFRCKTNMTLVGNTSTVCQLDGTWSKPLPKCLAPCVLPSVQYGHLRNKTAMGHLVPHGYHLVMDCDPSYEFSPRAAHVLCNNGTWTHEPKCEPARCKRLPKAPRHGMVIAPKTDHDRKARYSCKDGYTLRGNATSICLFGIWTGDPPYCQEVFCPFPGYIENGKVMLVGNMGLYDYRPYVRKVTNNKQIMYDCDRGYVLADGPVGATCVGGRWSPKDLPRCVPGQHPRLRWSREVREKHEEEDPKYAALIKRWEALQKFRSSSTDLLLLPKPKYPSVLERLRRWRRKRDTTDWDYPSHPAATWTEDEEEPENWMDKMQAAPPHSKSVVAKVGTLDKSKKGKGKGKGKSSGQRNNKGSRIDGGSEKATMCDPLPEADYIQVNIIRLGRKGQDNATNALGSIVTLNCTDGYSPTLKNATGKCKGGEWRPVKPDCVIMNCTVPALELGRYTLKNKTLNKGDFVKTDHTIEVSCNRGYSRQGLSSLYCLHGNWTTENFPSCQPAPCQLSGIRNGQFLGGYRQGLTIAHSAKVNYQCEPDFSRNPPQPVECLHGELRPRPPSCRPKGNGVGVSGSGMGTTGLGGNGYGSGQLPDSDFLGGSDITRHGATIGGAGGSSPRSGETHTPKKSSYSSSTRGRSCEPPAHVENSLVYRNGAPLLADEHSFPDNTEITFDCITSIMGEKTTWKIICEDGNWVGRSFSCVPNGDVEEWNFSPESACRFSNTEPNVIYFFNDQPINDAMVKFPPGTELVARCTDIGKYSMNGSNRRVCKDGKWDGQKPVCFGLNQENDYAMEKPPTILFRHQLEPIAQSNDGRLIVYPGAILHMECLWTRRFGTPKWNVSHNYRKYPEGWTTDVGRDSQLEYRLSIIHASGDDSGKFTCNTPTRHTHSVDIVVKAVHCPMLTPRPGMTISSQKNKLNSRVTFTCLNGNTLIGTEELICLPSGNWSAPIPVCESIECPEITNILDKNLRVTTQSREVGGRTIFTCAQSYGLRGPSESICLSTGEWSQPFPSCVVVHCEPPDTPLHGKIQGHGTSYKAGDLIQFNCEEAYMLEGQPIIACQETGRWSGPVPKCVPACSYPGTTINGHISLVKFYYKIGETITFSCIDGYELQGMEKSKCVTSKGSARWSSPTPTCALKGKKGLKGS